MRHLLDLTGDRFDLVDFTESTLFFDAVRVLPATLEFPVWGATLLVGFPGWSPELVKPRYSVPEGAGDVYVAGLATLRLAGVQGGALDVCLYEPDDARSFLRTARGEDFRLTREWLGQSSASSRDYEFDCELAWPHGACSLRLDAVGEVSLAWESEDGVPTDMYVRDPQRYRFKR